MGYAAKQKKVKVGIEGADKIVKELKAMEENASDVLMQGGKGRWEDSTCRCSAELPCGYRRIKSKP